VRVNETLEGPLLKIGRLTVKKKKVADVFLQPSIPGAYQTYFEFTTQAPFIDITVTINSCKKIVWIRLLAEIIKML
jgi:hypothetical protein